MALATFDEKGWQTDLPKIDYENMVVFRNNTKVACYLQFNNPKTFGIDLIGLEPGSEVHLPFRHHIPTECKPFCGHLKDTEIPTTAATPATVGREAVGTTSSAIPAMTIEPLGVDQTRPLDITNLPTLTVPWPPKKP